MEFCKCILLPISQFNVIFLFTTIIVGKIPKRVATRIEFSYLLWNNREIWSVHLSCNVLHVILSLRNLAFRTLDLLSARNSLSRVRIRVGFARAAPQTTAQPLTSPNFKNNPLPADPALSVPIINDRLRVSKFRRSGEFNSLIEAH